MKTFRELITDALEELGDADAKCTCCGVEIVVDTRTEATCPLGDIDELVRWWHWHAGHVS